MRSIIIDTQRRETYYIPNDLFEILDSSTEILSSSKNANIKDYLEFLINNELGFLLEKNDDFPKIDLKWEVPSKITNVIIEVENETNYNIEKVLSELNELACRNALIKFYKIKAINVIKSLVMSFEERGFKNIDIIMPYKKTLLKELTKLINLHPIIRKFTLTSADKNELIQTANDGMAILKTTTSKIDRSNTFKIEPRLFNLTVQFISESVNYNNYLNRKISIDRKGYIKNIPSFKTNYGHVNDIGISDVVSKMEFNKFWTVTKDKVEICKDCEHRYICPQIINTENEIRLKPSTCSYNPYTGEW